MLLLCVTIICGAMHQEEPDIDALWLQYKSIKQTLNNVEFVKKYSYALSEKLEELQWQIRRLTGSVPCEEE